MAVVRRRAPIAMRLGRARRRAVTRRASIVRYVQATSSLVVEAWSPAPVPAPVPAGLAHPPALVDPSGSVALPMGDVPPPDEGVPAGRMRRCAFRRLDLVAPADPRAATTYAVVCLYLDAADPTPIGDLETAVGVCGACAYPGVFRPDQA